MKKTLEEKLQMCKEHVEKVKSLSYVYEIYSYFKIDEVKPAVNL